MALEIRKEDIQDLYKNHSKEEITFELDMKNRELDEISKHNSEKKKLLDKLKKDHDQIQREKNDLKEKKQTADKDLKDLEVQKDKISQATQKAINEVKDQLANTKNEVIKLDMALKEAKSEQKKKRQESDEARLLYDNAKNLSQEPILECHSNEEQKRDCKTKNTAKKDAKETLKSLEIDKHKKETEFSEATEKVSAIEVQLFMLKQNSLSAGARIEGLKEQEKNDLNEINAKIESKLSLINEYKNKHNIIEQREKIISDSMLTVSREMSDNENNREITKIHINAFIEMQGESEVATTSLHFKEGLSDAKFTLSDFIDIGHDIVTLLGDMQ